MPAERTTMRHVREVLRLKFVGDVPTCEIARRVGVAPSTVRTTAPKVQYYFRAPQPDIEGMFRVSKTKVQTAAKNLRLRAPDDPGCAAASLAYLAIFNSRLRGPPRQSYEAL
jgi:hypothetical protein